MNLTHLSLFSGIGGLDLAAEWAGFETIGQCEWADYPTKVLEKHWPDVPRWRDIRTLTKENFHERTGLRTVDIVSGGFPCQPFSVAGKRRGKEDDRYLWPEMLRVIEELQPCWVIGENVVGIVNMALDQVLSDLESIGYATQAFVIPACAVDSPHRRGRCAIVGNKDRTMEAKHRRGRWTTDSLENTDSVRWGEQEILQKQQGRTEFERNGKNMAHSHGFNGGAQRAEREGQPRETRLANGGYDVPYPNCAWELQPSGKQQECGGRAGDCGRRAAQPGLGGMADGLSHWLDEPLNVPRIARGVKDRVGRLKCLGNAVVPQQFYPIFRAIAEIKRNGCHDRP